MVGVVEEEEEKEEEEEEEEEEAAQGFLLSKHSEFLSLFCEALVPGCPSFSVCLLPEEFSWCHSGHMLIRQSVGFLGNSWYFYCVTEAWTNFPHFARENGLEYSYVPLVSGSHLFGAWVA